MVILKLGYSEYAMDAKDAVTIIELLSNAETYEAVWNKAEDGGTTHHVYDSTTQHSITSISDNLYRMAKLAGKPVKPVKT